MPFHCASLLLVWVEDGSNQVFVWVGEGIRGISCHGNCNESSRHARLPAPEKLSGDPITTSVNIYALGGVLTELFGGRPFYPKMGCTYLALAHPRYFVLWKLQVLQLDNAT